MPAPVLRGRKPARAPPQAVGSQTGKEDANTVSLPRCSGASAPQQDVDANHAQPRSGGSATTSAKAHTAAGAAADGSRVGGALPKALYCSLRKMSEAATGVPARHPLAASTRGEQGTVVAGDAAKELDDVEGDYAVLTTCGNAFDRPFHPISELAAVCHRYYPSSHSSASSVRHVSPHVDFGATSQAPEPSSREDSCSNSDLIAPTPHIEPEDPPASSSSSSPSPAACPDDGVKAPSQSAAGRCAQPPSSRQAAEPARRPSDKNPTAPRKKSAKKSAKDREDDELLRRIEAGVSRAAADRRVQRKDCDLPTAPASLAALGEWRLDPSFPAEAEEVVKACAREVSRLDDVEDYDTLKARAKVVMLPVFERVPNALKDATVRTLCASVQLRLASRVVAPGAVTPSEDKQQAATTPTYPSAEVACGLLREGLTHISEAMRLTRSMYDLPLDSRLVMTTLMVAWTARAHLRRAEDNETLRELTAEAADVQRDATRHLYNGFWAYASLNAKQADAVLPTVPSLGTLFEVLKDRIDAVAKVLCAITGSHVPSDDIADAWLRAAAATLAVWGIDVNFLNDTLRAVMPPTTETTELLSYWCSEAAAARSACERPLRSSCGLADSRAYCAGMRAMQSEAEATITALVRHALSARAQCLRVPDCHFLFV
jgi:hypothetical protein